MRARRHDQTVAAFAGVQRIEQGRQQNGPSGAHRVPLGQVAAADIDLVAQRRVFPRELGDGDGEGLHELDPVHVGQGQSGLVQHPVHGCEAGGQGGGGIAPGLGPGEDAGAGAFGLAGDQGQSGAVAHRRGVRHRMAVVDDPSLQRLGVGRGQGGEGGGQRRQTLAAGLRACRFLVRQAVQRNARCGQRRALGEGGALLRDQGGGVHLGARDADVLGQTVGGDGDGEVAGARWEAGVLIIVSLVAHKGDARHHLDPAGQGRTHGARLYQGRRLTHGGQARDAVVVEGEGEGGVVQTRVHLADQGDIGPLGADLADAAQDQGLGGAWRVAARLHGVDQARDQFVRLQGGQPAVGAGLAARGADGVVNIGAQRINPSPSGRRAPRCRGSRRALARAAGRAPPVRPRNSGRRSPGPRIGPCFRR